MAYIPMHDPGVSSTGRGGAHADSRRTLDAPEALVESLLLQFPPATGPDLQGADPSASTPQPTMLMKEIHSPVLARWRRRGPETYSAPGELASNLDLVPFSLRQSPDV